MAMSTAKNNSSQSLPRLVRVEAAALEALARRLETTMAAQAEQTLGLMATCAAQGKRIAVTGIGKSGIIARKIAATLTSTGTPAFFLHPVEALHGDLGLLGAGDVAVTLSYSGETEELLRLLPVFERMGVRVIALTGCMSSTLAGAAAMVLDVSVSEEACGLGLAPTASTAAMLALGDALAMELSARAGFKAQDFADMHPGGRLGLRLQRVRDLMHRGDALPQVEPGTAMTQVIYEMSRKKLGMTTVLSAGALAGIISDGDLRRLLERMGPQAFERRAGDIMNRNPQTIAPGAFAADALRLMEERKITSLVVVHGGVVEGVVHLHDLWEMAPR